MNAWWKWSAAGVLAIGMQQACLRKRMRCNVSWAAACANGHGTAGVAQQGMESLAGVPRDELAVENS
ncbi:MAG: hypothetical protein U1F00_02340 [Rhodoferax sp.]